MKTKNFFFFQLLLLFGGTASLLAVFRNFLVKFRQKFYFFVTKQ